MLPRYWTSRHGGIWLSCPYDPGWLSELKHRVPYRQRSWDRERRLWWVGDPWSQEMVRFTEGYFGSCVRGPSESFQEPPHPHAQDGPHAQAAPKVPVQLSDYKMLHLDETAPPELVKVVYRTLCRLHHPDRGGDPELMVAVNTAYGRLKKRLCI